jgi:hypothetical protein
VRFNKRTPRRVSSRRTAGQQFRNDFNGSWNVF